MALMVNKFVGLRKLIISQLVKAAAGSTPATYKTVTIIGNKIGADGLELQADPIELSLDSFAGTEVYPVGTALKKATINLIPFSVADLGDMLPGGFDATQGTWNMFTDPCKMNDVTVAFERVCTDADGKHGANFLLRHANISLAHAVSIKRNAAFPLAVGLYPHFSLGSEYGLTNENANETMAWQVYNGSYDGSTDKVTYDAVSGS